VCREKKTPLTMLTISIKYSTLIFNINLMKKLTTKWRERGRGWNRCVAYLSHLPLFGSNYYPVLLLNNYYNIEEDSRNEGGESSLSRFCSK
jgi:hypothetical protein